MEAEVGFRGTEPRIYMYVSSCLESLGLCFFFALSSGTAEAWFNHPALVTDCLQQL